MSLSLIKVIFVLLSFIVTNPDIPQSVKDQALATVSEAINIEAAAEAIEPTFGSATSSPAKGKSNAPEIVFPAPNSDAAAITEMRANVDPNRACKSPNRKLNRILHLMCVEDGL